MRPQAPSRAAIAKAVTSVPIGVGIVGDAQGSANAYSAFPSDPSWYPQPQ